MPTDYTLRYLRYSDSDDEDRPKKTLAGWAEPDEVERQLRYQEDEIDPDELFGEVGDPDLEVMFGPRNKFRVRSSSANWHNGDGVTKAEIEDYGRRMGFRKD
ncbi:hypothetical protein DL93DRAFT_2052050 [Clavulina sp. PMI_390]|nr:hypothetical protein DL93DRAFT_2052050 [Clavulina sp. PMI_390]